MRSDVQYVPCVQRVQYVTVRAVLDPVLSEPSSGSHPLRTVLRIPFSQDGYSRKAKLQGSVKYVDQATGGDLDPTSEKLMYDLTARGMRSELNERWNAGEGSRSPSPDPGELEQLDAAVAQQVGSRRHREPVS